MSTFNTMNTLNYSTACILFLIKNYACSNLMVLIRLDIITKYMTIILAKTINEHI